MVGTGKLSCIDDEITVNTDIADVEYSSLVPEAIKVSHESYLTTFIKGSPPRNGSNYVKTGGVLMPPKWGCGGQEVPECGF